MDGCMNAGTSKQIRKYVENKQASKQAKGQTNDQTFYRKSNETRIRETFFHIFTNLLLF